MNSLFSWFRKNRLEVIVLLLIIAAASFLRFYRISEYMNFLGDEGRDALMMKRILMDHDFPLLGPPTSVGNVYLGPLYYYMMAIPSAFFWLNPVASAGMVAVIGVIAVGLVYYLAKEWFGKLPAVLAAALYAISPVNIVSTRSSWNPSPAPFFALLAVLGFYLSRKHNDFKWLILSGASLAFAVQMHYLAFILLPVSGLLWLYELFAKKAKPHFWFGTFGAIVIFLILMTPLIIFDFRYNFLNFRAMQEMFTAKEGAVSFNLLNTFSSTIPIYKDKLIGRYLAAENIWLGFSLAVLILIPLFVWFKRIIKIPWEYFTLGGWLIIGLVGLSFYKGPIYDHYLGFLAPAPFLFLAGFAALFKKAWKIAVSVVLLLVLGFFNLQKSPILQPPNKQLQKTKEIAKFVIEKSKGEPFNFALLAERNYDAAYQFYLEQYGHKPKLVPFEITPQLFVVCEDQVCNPVVSPKHEIAAYGMTKVAEEYQVWGVKVFKLVANPEGK